MASERVVSVRLLDVNDNIPKLTESKVFICVKKPEPVIIKASDGDSAPFSQPFSFVLGSGKKSPNWELQGVDGTGAKRCMNKSVEQFSHYVLVTSFPMSRRYVGSTHAEENAN